MTRRLSVIILLVCIASNAFAATPMATYQFDNSFTAQQGGVPALVPTDPQGASAFVLDTVLGESRQVWSFDGNASPSTQQAGLTLNTTGLVSPTSYSVDMVFLFTEGASSYRRIIDVENRQSDSGFYVFPSNNLGVYPVSGSSATWSNNAYHHVVLTNDGVNVNGYIDGVSQFSAATNVMNLNNGNNPGLLMNFFLENLSGASAEYSDGRVALIRLWDGLLTPTEAQDLATHPFVPEPSTFVLSAVSLLLLGVRRRKA